MVDREQIGESVSATVAVTANHCWKLVCHVKKWNAQIVDVATEGLGGIDKGSRGGLALSDGVC